MNATPVPTAVPSPSVSPQEATGIVAAVTAGMKSYAAALGTLPLLPKRVSVDGDRSAAFGSFSPDGKWFVYARPDPPSMKYIVRLVSAANPSESRTVAPGFSPTWSADGQEILFAQGPGIWAVRRTGEEFSKPRPVYEGQFLVAGQIINVHPDGRLLLAVPKRQQPVREIRVIPHWLAKVTAGWK